MKRLIIFIFISIISIYIIPSKSVYANDQYARVETATNLYKLSTTTNELTEIYCIIEKSYYVKIINNNGNSYKVNYNGQIGYVKKNDVKLVSNTPNTPFPSNIKIVIGSDCNLRTSPTTKSTSNNILTTLKKNESNIIFIGRIFADEAIDFGGTTWYYIKYGEYTGYIYNKYVKSITPIYENSESFNYYIEPLSANVNPLTNTPSLILVAILLLPVIAILLILYLPRKHINKNISKQKVINEEKY